jgi:hypothetical protein
MVPWLSLAAEESDTARQHPECFEPLPGFPVGGRERVLATDGGSMGFARSSPAPKARRAGGYLTRPAGSGSGRESWRPADQAPECRQSRRRSSTRLRIDTGARGKLGSIYERTTAVDYDETGGLLFGVASDELIEVIGVSGPGPAAGRCRSLFRHDPAYNDEQAAMMTDRGLELVGEWHTHSQHRALSAADLKAHSGRRKLAGVDRYVALLLTPIETSDAAGVGLDAWIIRDSHGRDVAEEAVL